MWNIGECYKVSVTELQWYENSIKVYTCMDHFLLLFVFKSISKIVRNPYKEIELDFWNVSV